MKARILVTLVVLLAPVFAFAGITCATATVLKPNGTETNFDFAAPSSSVYYQFSASVGRSYSVEVRQNYDDVNTDITVTPWTENTCAATALPATVSTIAADPALPANASRFSFTAAANETVYLKVTNGNGSTGRYIDVSATDTTMYNPRWATAQGYLTVYGVQNTTSQIAHVSMAATTDFGGTGTTTFNLTLQPGQRQLVALGPGLTINIAAGMGGYLVLTHDLPAGGIVADAYFANNTSLVPAVITSPRSASGGH